MRMHACALQGSLRVLDATYGRIRQGGIVAKLSGLLPSTELFGYWMDSDGWHALPHASDGSSLPGASGSA
jgi:hypothetical protein